MHSKHKYWLDEPGLAECGGDVQTAQSGHGDIHHDYIGFYAGDSFLSFFSVTRFENRPIGPEGREQTAYACTNDGVIVNYQNLCCHVCLSFWYNVN